MNVQLEFQIHLTFETCRTSNSNATLRSTLFWLQQGKGASSKVNPLGGAAHEVTIEAADSAPSVACEARLGLGRGTQ
jgi:hypothetical protein